MFVTRQTLHRLARPAFMTDRSDAFHLRQQEDRVRTAVRSRAATDFFNILTGPELLQITEAHLPEHRERLYPPSVTLSMFLQQALATDSSCQQAVNGWAAQSVAEGLSPKSVRTGAYCRARQTPAAVDGPGVGARHGVGSSASASAAQLALARSDPSSCWTARGCRCPIPTRTRRSSAARFSRPQA